jgi:uncharacterized protein YggE
MHPTPRATPRLPALPAGLLVAAMAFGTVPAHAQAPAPARTLSVSGQGEVRGEPDRAFVTLGVEARSPKMETARAGVTRTVEAVLKLTRDLKVDPKYVHATRITIQPEYNWDGQARERTLLGYLVARQVQVELRNLDQLGALLEKAVDAGVNQVGDPQLDASRKRELEREALAKAVEDARQNAEVVARAAGVKLGGARTIAAQSVSAPQPIAYRMAARAEAAPGAEGSYQSGEITFTASVQVEFDLVP